MSINHLAFVNLGGAEIGVLLAVAVLPFLLTLYCLIDIFRSKFKDSNTRLLLLVIVLLAPVLGSIIYLLLRKNYKVNEFDSDSKMPL